MNQQVRKFSKEIDGNLEDYLDKQIKSNCNIVQVIPTAVCVERKFNCEGIDGAFETHKILKANVIVSFRY